MQRGKNLTEADSANYRGIALSSVFGKIFDRIVLNRYADELSTSKQQFGFRKKIFHYYVYNDFEGNNQLLFYKSQYCILYNA